MEKILPFVVVGALLVSGLAFSQDTPPQGESRLEKRVTALEKDLEDERKAHDETRRLLDQTIEYLKAQAKEGSAMMASLDASESAGFTAGINFRSREILLSGFRGYWGGMQKGLPGVKQPAPAAER